MKIFTYSVIGIVVIAIAAGFIVAGSPNEERLRRFDDRRVQDLESIQSEIITYWQNKGKLPDTLTVLQDPLRGFSVPHDPETQALYGYELRGPLTFALCADFDRPYDIGTGKVSPVPAVPYGYMGSPNWNHGTGHTCFERAIDKDFYTPRKPAP